MADRRAVESTNERTEQPTKLTAIYYTNCDSICDAICYSFCGTIRTANAATHCATD
jgi:hypothetical protein